MGDALARTGCESKNKRAETVFLAFFPCLQRGSTAMYGDMWEHMKVWYVCDYAKSGRSKCKEFRCKLPIGEGELRIGLETEEDDHWGSQLGWYHPACLVRTFSYSKGANKRITNATQIKGFAALDDEDKMKIRDLLSGKAGAAEAPAPAADAARRYGGQLTIAVDKSGDGTVVRVGGATFAIKDEMRNAGGKWDGATKAWVFHDSAGLLKFLRLPNENALMPTFDLKGLNEAAPSSQGGTAKVHRADSIVPVELVADLEGMAKYTLERLCKLRGVAKSGTKAQMAQRLKDAAAATPVGDTEYKSGVWQLVSGGSMQLAGGRGASDLPWDQNGNDK